MKGSSTWLVTGLSRLEWIRVLGHFSLVLILCSVCNWTRGAWATSPPGFLYIDCGAPAAYVDTVTGIQWVPDDGFIFTGVNHDNIPNPTNSEFSEFTTLRYFNGSHAKDCYSLPVTPGVTYLIRASFYYGHYDNGVTYPTFQMAIDATIVANISMDATSGPIPGGTFQEFVFFAQRNVTYVCLQRDSSNANPFISAIALRPTKSYGTDMDILLSGNHLFRILYRLNLGGMPNSVTRFPNDVYDRYWFGYNVVNPWVSSTITLYNLSTPNVVATHGWNESIPSLVLQTCLAMPTLGNMTISLPSPTNIQAWIEFYFVELDLAQNATSRAFELDSSIITTKYSNTFINPYNNSGGFYSEWRFWQPNITLTSSLSKFVFFPQLGATSGPSVNALELYEVTNPTAMTTNNQDELAIDIIKQTMSLKDWIGDPCLPISHSWLTCGFSLHSVSLQLQILTVNLSGYQLNATISPNFSQLASLTSLYLDNCGLSGPLPDLSALVNLNTIHLQDNNLIGPLPNWLASLPQLTELFVENNNFSGPIPNNLRSKNGFRYTPGNPFLGNNPISSPKASNHGVIIGVVIGIILVLGFIIFFIIYFICLRHRSNEHNTTPTRFKVPTSRDSNPKNICTGAAKVYPLSKIIEATENFQSEIGKGGFGSVYYGKLDGGQEVAVKVLDIASQQGSLEFFNEVNTLSKVHHKNLVELVGYCMDKGQQILIYEYLHQGSLHDHLQRDMASNVKPLDWNTRLNIALNAAQGLDYLHTGCNPSMIHRDVKSSNILLSSKMENAKVSDFGLSKIMVGENATHVSTVVKGTPGYLDPEYYTTQRLSPKSDVFGFGVVLLELITGRLPINATIETHSERYLCTWVHDTLKFGNIEMILDPALQAPATNLVIVGKVLDIALQSVKPQSIDRPTMGEVVDALQQAKDSTKDSTIDKLHVSHATILHRRNISSMSILSSFLHSGPQFDEISPR